MLTTETSFMNHSKFELTFTEAVKVTESFFESVSIPEIFSAIGGTLGLWLGVGVMQILEYGANIGNIVFASNKNKDKDKSVLT